MQNAAWATHFLLRKFNINNRDDLIGTDFGKYVKYKRPESRGGKPFTSGKTWKTVRDPWRGISRTSFGLDYFKPMKVSRDSGVEVRKDWTGKMMELSCYDDNDNPIYGYDGERKSSGLHADRADSIPLSVCSENCKPCLAHIIFSVHR